MNDSEWTNFAFTPKKFSRGQHSNLKKFLEDKRLGDNSSRELFINDVELYLGIFDQDESKDGGQTKLQLEDIKKQSDKLIRLLDKDNSDTDRWIIEGMIGVELDMKINESTYGQIKNNIELLRNSCEWSIDAIKPKRQYRTPGKDREYISQIARRYFKHFSKEPSHSRNSKFEQVLGKVNTLSGIDIKIGEKILKLVLSDITF